MCDTRLKLLVAIVDLSAGTGTFCRSLGLGLARHFAREIKPSLLLMRKRQLLPEEREGYEEVHTAGAAVHDDWRRSFETPMDIVRLRRVLSRIPADIIFTIGTYANLLLPMVHDGRPIILSEHMNMSRRVRVARFGRIMRALMKRVYPRHLVVCAAPGMTRDLEVNFGARRTAVISNGLDIDRVRELANEDPGPLPTNRPYIIAVGRLVPQKDFGTLMRAVAAARLSGMDLDLVFVGDGEMRTELDELGRSLGLLGAVHFVGHRSNPYPLIKRARMLALTSLWEGFAYVPVEAMALDVPCVATISDGPLAIFDNGRFGMLVSPSDPASLSAALIKMNEPLVHAHYVEQSKIRAQELSLERMARAYRDLFMRETRRGATDAVG